MEVADYDFNLVYKKGANNANADTLSRIKIEYTQEMIPTIIEEYKESLIRNLVMKWSMAIKITIWAYGKAHP